MTWALDTINALVLPFGIQSFCQSESQFAKFITEFNVLNNST